MSRLSRYTQLLFGSGASAGQMAQFGSFAAGTPVTYSGSTVTPAQVQALSQYLAGWYSAVVGNGSAAKQDLNSLDYLWSYQLAYLFQQGIAEYDASTVYYTNSLCTSGNTIYVSLTNSNTGNNPVSSPSNWQVLVSPNPMTTLGDSVYGAASGVPTRLPGNTAAALAYLTQTGTGSVSAAPVWIQKGHALSSSCGSFSTTSGTNVGVTNFSISVTTNGGPVLITVSPDGIGTYSYIGLTLQRFTAGNIGASINVTLTRNGTPVKVSRVYREYSNNGTYTAEADLMYIPAGALTMIDRPGAGTYTYAMLVQVAPLAGVTGTCNFQDLAMAADEL